MTRPSSADARLRPSELQALGLIGCAEGMSTPELMVALQVTFQTAHERVTRLVHVGLAVRVKAPGVAHKRFFRHARHAAAWLESHEAAKRAEAAKAAALRAEKAAARAAKALPKRVKEAKAVNWATVNKPARKPAPAPMCQAVPTNPNGVEPTVIATPVDRRFCVGPGEAPPAVFRRYAPGVNPMTGEAWGVAA